MEFTDETQLKRVYRFLKHYKNEKVYLWVSEDHFWWRMPNPFYPDKNLSEIEFEERFGL